MTPSRHNALPRWRGFNLLYFFHGKSDCTPLEDDYRWIADWGFDFVRLPMSYILWTDVLDVLTAFGIGYALWNFRGSFGILDSERADVAYTPWHGHKLDKQLLELMQAH